MDWQKSLSLPLQYLSALAMWLIPTSVNVEASPGKKSTLLFSIPVVLFWLQPMVFKSTKNCTGEMKKVVFVSNWYNILYSGSAA